MNRPPEAPHADDLEEALQHFNTQFRRRYRLPSITAKAIRRVAPDVDALLADLAAARADGVADASCALLSRIVLSTVPTYAIGLLTAAGQLTVLAPRDGDDASYVGGHVLLVNPLGGRDNWTSVSRWFRRYGAVNARRQELAGLASEHRPNETANLKLLQDAAATHQRGILLPPDEAFSAERAAEVGFIFDIPADTLRSWKQRHRSQLAAKKPGRRPKNR